MPFDIHNTYSLLALMEEITPVPSFFRDRYFPTGAGDLFSTDSVVTEFRKGTRKMAAFVAPRIGDIPVERGGYEINTYKPPKIAPSRLLTIDDLASKGFGEMPYAGYTPEQRAARLVLDDLSDLERRIQFREEWMAAQAILTNGFSGAAMADEDKQVDTYDIRFYNGVTSDHLYTVSSVWTTFAAMRADVAAMANDLTDRGLPAEDLIIGTDVAAALLTFSDLPVLVNKTSGIITGEIEAKPSPYPGVVYLGDLNFDGHILHVFVPRETYEADNGTTTAYFPAKGAAVTAPASGRMLYASVTQIPRGGDNFVTISAKRVPKLVVDDDNEVRKLRVTSKPLPMPRQMNPWIYAANAVS